MKRAASDPHFTINSKYTADPFLSKWNHAFTSTTADSGVDGTAAEVIASPFKAGVVPDFLVDEDGSAVLDLAELIDELRDQNWNKKNNDLYYFYQTDDLKGCKSNQISTLCRFLCTEVLEWMQRATGFQLNKRKIDIFAGRYVDTGTLLCHDDQLDGRRIAFILYLNREWKDNYGGALELFDVDDTGTSPDKIVRRIMPRFNTLAFFEVSKKSFHQVGEVTAEGQERWSITGWYHDDELLKRQHTQREKPPFHGQPPIMEDKIELKDWINPQYISDSVKMNIRETFLEQSSLQLQSFLAPEKCELLISSLKNIGMDAFEHRGSPLHSRYTLISKGVSPEWDALHSFFASDVFLNYLREITCLELKRGNLEIQRFGHGDYTLLYDGDPTHGREALDVMFCLLPSDDPWDMAHGGVISYIAGKEELISVTPVTNALSLVFRDIDTMGFVKFINHHARDKTFIRCNGVFVE